MATTIFYNNKKCNCKIRCRAGNLNSAGGATGLILHRRPPEDDEDIPTTDICDMHTITTRTALRNDHNHIHNNNDPEKCNYQRQQQQQQPHTSHTHRKSQPQQSQSRHSRHHHPRHHQYIVLPNHVIIIIILLLFIKILFVSCQQPIQIEQEPGQQHHQHQHHHHQQHPPHPPSLSSSKTELTGQSQCSGSCSQDKATAAEIQLKYMQQHILARLKFTKLPNMSHVPHVPENIIADFMRSTQQHKLQETSKKYLRKSTYKVRKNGGYYGQQNRHQKRSHSNGFSDMDDYQGDAPVSENTMKKSEYYETLYGDSGFSDYQGDAPAEDLEEEFVDEYDDDDDDEDYDNEFDDDDEPFYSVVDKVYIIPTVTIISKYTL